MILLLISTSLDKRVPYAGTYESETSRPRPRYRGILRKLILETRRGGWDGYIRCELISSNCISLDDAVRALQL